MDDPATPPLTQISQMVSDDQNIQVTEGRGGMFVTPDPEDGPGIQSSFTPEGYRKDLPTTDDTLENSADAEPDDDIVSIAEEDASEESRYLWSIETPFKPQRAAKLERVEQTPGPDIFGSMLTFPVPETMATAPQYGTSAAPNRDNRTIFAAQQAMKQQMMRKRKTGAASIFGGNAAKSQKYAHDSIPSVSRNDNAEDKSEDNHDDSWMEESHQKSNQDELSSLKAVRDALLNKEVNRDDILHNGNFQLLKTVEKIKSIERRQQKGNYFHRDKPSGGDEGGEHLAREDRGNSSGIDEPDGDLICWNDSEFENHPALNLNNPGKDQSKKGSKGKGKGKGNTDARSVEHARRMKEAQKLQKEKAKMDAKNKKGSAVPKGKGKKLNIGRQSAKSKNKARKEEIQSKEADEAMRKIFESLTSSDQIADRIEYGDSSKAPDIFAKTKKNQLEALLKSIPEDYDTHKAKTERKDLLEASKRFGAGKVKAVNGKWLLKGMRSNLLHHQLLAADWMVTRELSSDEPLGGLLGDGMGLGKTVEMLATMVGNPPSDEDILNKSKATLIVLPSSVVRQWIDEIRKHVDPRVFKRILQYKASSEMPMIFLEDSDIVITTYSEVMNSLPFPKTSDDKKDAHDMGIQKWIENNKSASGNLHKMKWYRVVLDEAHAIKNHRSRTSLACVLLNSTFRWAMTGTPALNSLDELFPYFSFLRVTWSKDIYEFRKRFGDPDTVDSTRRLAVMLAVIMMRRTMKDKILGRPIVDLPMPHPETKYLVMSQPEKIIYRMLEDKFRSIINIHFEKGTAQKNYGVFLAQLIRLRQATAHPFLLEQCFRDIFDAEDLLILKSKLESLNGRRLPIYEQIQQWMAPEKNVETGKAVESAPFGRSDFGKHFHFDTFLDKIDEEELLEKMVCRVCGDLPEPAMVTECRHIFCRDCLENEVHRQAAETESDYTECPTCEKAFFKPRPYKRLKLKHANDDNCSSQGNRRDSQNNRKSTEKQSSKDSWLKLCINKDEALLPSAKTIAVKAQILKWVAESPNDKILIFTQFRMMAKIVGLICDEEKWGHVSFTGDMSTKQRHEVVVKFHEDPSIKVMVAGLKCGGQALNLTCANRCISIDLWWNHAVEQQAYGRIFRIGQNKETYFTRFVCKNTVDERMLKMQSEKINMIDKAMQDTGEKIEPLNVKELARLFGDVTEVDGTTQIIPDYNDDDDDEGEEGDLEVLEPIGEEVAE